MCRHNAVSMPSLNVAEWNGRSLNREIELLLKSFVQTFEKQHGTIDKDALAKFFTGNES